MPRNRRINSEKIPMMIFDRLKAAKGCWVYAMELQKVVNQSSSTIGHITADLIKSGYPIEKQKNGWRVLYRYTGDEI